MLPLRRFASRLQRGERVCHTLELIRKPVPTKEVLVGKVNVEIWVAGTSSAQLSVQSTPDEDHVRICVYLRAFREVHGFSDDEDIADVEVEARIVGPNIANMYQKLDQALHALAAESGVSRQDAQRRGAVLENLRDLQATIQEGMGTAELGDATPSGRGTLRDRSVSWNRCM